MGGYSIGESLFCFVRGVWYFRMVVLCGMVLGVVWWNLWVRGCYRGLLVGLVLGLWDFPRLDFGFLSWNRRVLFERDVIRWDSFLIRIEWILSNNSEEQLSMSWRKKKEWEQRN